MMRFRVSFLLPLLLLVSCAYVCVPVHGVCTAPPPLTEGEQVHVAVLMFIAGAPQGKFDGNPMDVHADENPGGYSTLIIQPWMIRQL